MTTSSIPPEHRGAQAPRRSRVRTWVVGAWSGLLALLLLGPALGPGYVLSYDMVWVPDLPVRPSALGLTTGLPRAVPSDAWVAVLDEVIGGLALQKLALVLPLLAGGLGIARLARRLPTAAVLVAVAVYQWNAFVVERLVIGHWPLLIGYGALPWLLVLLDRWRRTGHYPAALGPVLVAGSLNASAGIATGIVVLVHLATTRAARSQVALSALLLAAANAPWVVSGLLAAASGRGSAAAASAFALDGEGSLPAPLAALSLGGIWNSEVVPDSRTSFLGWLTTLLVIAVLATGWRTLRQRFEPVQVRQWTLLWAIGLILALLTWAAPGLGSWLAGTVPGGGVLRDGARLLYLGAPLLALSAAAGVAAAWDWFAERDRWVLWPVALLPVFLLPEALWGVRASLLPAHYPASYLALSDVVTEQAPPGDALILPLSSYRRPAWNHDRKVLDPLWRLQPRDPVASDDLVVARRHLGSEDPRVAEVGRALAAATPALRAEGLRQAGIGVVIVDRTAPGGTEPIAGQVLSTSPELTVIGLTDARPIHHGPMRVAAIAAAWLGYLVLCVTGPLRWAGRRWRSRHTDR